MKKIVFYSIMVASFVIVLSCQKDKISNRESQELVIEHPQYGFNLKFKRNSAAANILDVSNEKSIAALLNLVNGDYSKYESEYITLVNFKLEKSDNYSYLIFEGYNKATKKVSSFAYLIELDPDGKTAFFRQNDELSSNSRTRVNSSVIIEDSHKCTGDPCSCCAFTKNDAGAIIGCKCNGVLFSSTCPFNTSQFCSHEITSGGGGGVQPYQQCGGIGWSGPTVCVSGYTCVKVNDYFSQCQP
jgi:hypothetical protein